MAVGAGDVRAGGAYVEIGGEDRSLNRVLKRARERVKRFASDVGQLGRRLVVAGTVVAAPLALSVRKFASYGDQIAKMARRTGFSTEAVSRLGYAAQISGTSIEALEVGLKRMSRTIFDADIGLAESKRTFDLLGISLDVIKAKSPEQQFMMMAEALRKIEDPSKKAALAQLAMGRSGTMLIPLLDLGAKGIKKLGVNAEKMGIVLGLKTAGGAEELTDAITDMKYSFLGLQLQIAMGLLPNVMKWITKIQMSIMALTDWVKLHKDAVVVVAKVAGKLLAVGVALITVSALMKAFLFFFSPGGALALAGVAVLLLADAFGVLPSGISEIVGGIKVFGRSVRDWMTYSAFSLLKFYEKFKVIAVGIFELWRPVVERMKGVWRDMSVALAESFLWAIEKVVGSMNWLVSTVGKARSSLLYKLGAITKTQYDIEIALAEQSLIPGAKKWLREMKAGLEEYGEELDTKTKEGITKADADWAKSRDERVAKMRKEIAALDAAQKKYFDEVEERDKKSAAEQEKFARERRERIEELRARIERLAHPPRISPDADDLQPSTVRAASQRVIGTMRGWRVPSAVGGGGGEAISHLRSIDNAVTKTARHVINLTGRYGGG